RITAGHALESGMGEYSPLGRLYDLDAQILLLGIGHATPATARFTWPSTACPHRGAIGRPRPSTRRRAERGSTTTTSISTPATSRTSAPRSMQRVAHAVGRVGAATAHVLRQRDAVDFAVGWLTR